MVADSVPNRNVAIVSSVSSLCADLKRHPNFVKSSSQLKYLVLVQKPSITSPRQSFGETDRIVRLTAHLENFESPFEFVHGYLSDLPSNISARNENCASLASRDTFGPLIRSDYTLRRHLIRPDITLDSSVIVKPSESSEKKSKCVSPAMNRTIGDLFAKMKTVNSRPEKNRSTSRDKDSQTTRSSKMQFGDHEYCSTKYPLVKAFQKQASKIKSVKTSAQSAVKAEEPVPAEVSAASSSKRQWIDTSSSDEEQKSAEPATTSKAAPKRQCTSTKQDSSQVKTGVAEPSKVKTLPKSSPAPTNAVRRTAASTSKRTSRSATKKAPSQTQSGTALSFVKKSSK